MIFILEHDDKSLFICASEQEALTQVEAIDVENGEYTFFDEYGQIFAATVTPHTLFRQGKVHLHTNGNPDRKTTLSLVQQATTVIDKTGKFRTREDVIGFLT